MDQDQPIFHSKQVKFLTEFYFSNKERILIITGPRGSGKTSLIKQFLKEIKGQINNNYIYLSYSNSHTGLKDLILKSTKLLIIDDFEETNQGWGLNIKIVKSISDRFENLKIIITTEKTPFSLPKQTDFIRRTQHLEIEPLNKAELDLFYNKVLKHSKLVATDYDKIIQSIMPTIGALTILVN
jgi:predicted AAA+ superfamily ATPase